MDRRRRLSLLMLAAALPACATRALAPGGPWASGPPAGPIGRTPGARGSEHGHDPPRWSAPADCTFAISLPKSCGECVRGSCCEPPVRYGKALVAAVACLTRCRDPLPPQDPPLSDADREAAIDACRDQCRDLHPDPRREATRLDECMASRCAYECALPPAS